MLHKCRNSHKFSSFLFVIISFLAFAGSAQAATYYIAPNGSNSNNGTSPSTPWLTFDYALSSGRAWCGNTLVLLDGEYGYNRSTGMINLQNANCTAGNELRITAQNQRRARIDGDGTASTVRIYRSSYIIVDGLYARSRDYVYPNPADARIGGEVFTVRESNHVVIRNTLGYNPNRANNSHIWFIVDSQDVLLEDNEGYYFHRHCAMGFKSERVTVRRQYCHPRAGADPSIYSGGGMIRGKAGALFSMYPCKDCIVENSVADGNMFISEMNATYNGNILMSGSKVLGSICLTCGHGNGLYVSSRNEPDLNHAPQNILIENVAIVDTVSGSAGVRASSSVNVVVQNFTVTGAAGGGTGVSLDNNPRGDGATPAQQSATVRDSVVQGMGGAGFNQESGSYNTLVTSNLYSYNNRPASSGSWGSVSTNNPGMGSCKVFIPENSPLKRAGTNGGDIGANVLCRYENGVLTQTQLWNWQTGQFPCGAIVAGVNDVAGSSCSDVHRRLNVNTNGCNLPATPSCRQPAPPNFPSIPPSGGFVPPILRGPDGEVCPSGF